MSENITLIGEFEKNTQEKVRVTLQEVREHTVFDMRVWWRKEEYDDWIPTRKGLSLRVEQYEELMNLLKNARGKISELFVERY